MNRTANRTDSHYIATRLEAYTYTSLVLGPLATASGVVALAMEIAYSYRRTTRERLAFHILAVCEIVSGLMQVSFGILYFIIVKHDDEELEWYAEAANAAYVSSVIFSCCTIMQISYQRWLDIVQLRVGGIRPLHTRHWIEIVCFTACAVTLLVANKVFYYFLSQNKESRALKTMHTLTYVAIAVSWFVIFLACSVYNIRIIGIAHNVRRQRGGNAQPAGLNTRWMRITLWAYNLASILFFVKILDGIYLTESHKSYPKQLHIVGMINHILQTTALLAVPVLWLFCCTHFTIDYKRARHPPPN